MENKSTNTEETKQSTVVLNDEVNKIQDDTKNPESDTPEDTTQGPIQDDTTNHESDILEEAGDGDNSNPDHNPTDQGSTGGTDTKSNPGQTSDIPSNDCGQELEEPWAHDELLQDADGHTGLQRELCLHCGVTYDVVKMWLAEIATATDKDAVIDKIAWHIPTGGPKSIKVHHKAKIIAALNALKYSILIFYIL